jgi:DNA-binding HxlR family transcriptional regulator
MTRHRTTTASRGAAPSAKPDPVEAAATALAAVGPVTAAQLATHLGVAYPTITPRLRRLETDGRAERIKEPGTGRTLWHTTPPTTQPTPGTPTGYGGGPGETDHAPGETTAHTPGDAAPDPGDTADAQSTPDTTLQPTGRPAASTDHCDDPPATGDGVPPAAPARHKRRRNGSIAADILAVMRADPDATFKVSHLSTALPGTSAGAIANSLHKLVLDGSITQVCEKPATYQAA